VNDSSLKSIQVQVSIDRVTAGDPAARDDLICCSCDRLEGLVTKMLGRYDQVKRWERADFVVQRVMMRLYRSLEGESLESSRGFLRQASAHIRRELIALAANFFDAERESPGSAGGSGSGEGTLGETIAGESLAALDPARLVAWTNFHRRIDALEDEDREVFELLWYQGLTQPEATDLMGASRRTMIARWQGARLRLFDTLGGQLPPYD
jgi:RNA polymerase sigma-70 factor (ECF subfamily)